jgi:hypothetical protein
MLTLYRAGYSLAGVTIHLTRDIKSSPACSHFTGLDTHSQVYRAAIQRRGSILAWAVILSVYGADTIAIDFSLSAPIS